MDKNTFSIFQKHYIISHEQKRGNPMNIHLEIQKILENTTQEEQHHLIKFECSDEISDLILEELTKQNISTGFVVRENPMYETMKVKDYLDFFANAHHHRDLLGEAIETMQLQSLLTMKCKKLNAAQRLRVSIARVMLQDCDLYYLQEPLKEVDDESCRIILQWLEALASKQKRAILTSMSLKQLYLMGGCTYYINRKQIMLLEEEDSNPTQLQNPVMTEKISVRSKDKILLFNPIDIDYMESVEGKVFVNVRYDAFACNATLDELEKRLKRYGFYRCHRSYLVNMQKVKEVSKWTRNSYSLKLDTMENVNIPLSKGRIDEMKELYHIES